MQLFLLTLLLIKKNISVLVILTHGDKPKNVAEAEQFFNVSHYIKRLSFITDKEICQHWYQP